MEKPRPPLITDSPTLEHYARYLSGISIKKIRRKLRIGNDRNPSLLYRYIPSSYKDEWLRSYLVDSDIYLNSCTQFNDPFDSDARFIKEENTAALRKQFHKLVKRAEPGLAYPKRIRKVTQMIQGYRENPSFMEDLYAMNTSNLGICCLSEKPKNLLMWSHYSSEHKGIVLQFDVARDPVSLLYATKVKYSDEYPTWDLNYSEDNQFAGLMYRKSQEWIYEKEWRIVRIGGARTFHAFKPEALTGIIFGCRVEEPFRSRILSILQERKDRGMPSIALYQAKRHPSKYKLQVFRSEIQL